jgi:hypothetical protein
MTYSTWTRVLLTSAIAEVDDQLRGVTTPLLRQIVETVFIFLRTEVSPSSSLQFEESLDRVLRELGRIVVEWTYNHVESDDPQSLPHDVQFEGGGYRRLNRKTPNRHVATRFGKITLWRFGYRDWDRDGGEPILFPLERALGLVGGASSALASATGRYFAQAGATQEAVLERLRREHGVVWGTKKLREVTASLAQAMGPFSRQFQAGKVLAWLEDAFGRKGNRRPVLCIGRDGISLGMQPDGSFEVATTATMTLYDRQGKRLGTVYLAQPPELGQQTMSDELTALLEEVLQRWEGPTPQLCYVTDAGDNETAYYRKVLRSMRHPRTGQRLEWQWGVDYYHASQRITVLAEALFGQTRAAESWARRMRKLLLKPNGPSRVLHAAAARRSGHGVIAHRRRDYKRAYEYLRQRTKFMQYWEHRRRHLPIGSGITEAACKTVFTQRLKLSGMRWKHEGARTVLTLRVILLSGIWEEVYAATLKSSHITPIRTYQGSPAQQPAIAA